MAPKAVLRRPAAASQIETVQANVSQSMPENPAPQVEPPPPPIGQREERKSKPCRIVFCTFCNACKFGPWHKSQNGEEHVLRAATEAEKAEYNASKERPRGAVAASVKRHLGESDALYRMEFGQKKGKSLSDLLRTNRSYIDALVNSKAHHSWPLFKKALVHHNIVEEDDGPQVSIHLLDSMVVPESEPRSQRAKKHRAAVSLAKNCSACGQSGHNAAACPVAPRRFVGLLPGSYYRAGKEAKEKARYKYTHPPLQPTSYSERPRSRARAPVHRSDLALKRAPPLVLARWMVEDGLFINLNGKDCLRGKDCMGEAKMLKGKLVQGKPVLKLVGSQEGPLVDDQSILNITKQSVSYRCGQCRARFSVITGHPLFNTLGRQGHGSISPSLVIFVWWGFIEDKSLTCICRELNLNEAVVTCIIDVARLVLAEDAVLRQQEVVFGRFRHGKTCDVEVDESCFGKWRVPADLVAGKPQQNFWYVWVGVVQRGDLSKIWLAPVEQSSALPLGVTMNWGVNPRLPPLSDHCWRKYSSQVFHEGDNVIQHSDSAQAYKRIRPPGVLETYQVNHSEGEFARSEYILANAITRERRPGMAGSMTIDKTWRDLKEQCPGKGNASVKTPAGRDRKANLGIRLQYYLAFVKKMQENPFIITQFWYFCPGFGSHTCALSGLPCTALYTGTYL